MQAGSHIAANRVLIADDDDGLRRILVRLATRAGYEVTDVRSGAQAIAALREGTFDAVVSDVNMPDGGGLDLLREVRTVDLDVPVILMTGEPSVKDASEALEYGAFRYLTKPVDNVALIATLEKAARTYALARLRREASLLGGTYTGATDRAGIEVRLDSALRTLWLAFQPIFDAKTGSLYGVEALMRSQESSLPHPGAVLDAASQLQRIADVGRCVRRLAAAACSARAGSFSLFVNLHPDDLMDPDLASDDAPLTELAPQVVLEVTERASLTSSTQLSERIARLRALGFRLAVDDIGAGYSGLTTFAELTPEIVKIDMSLVRGIDTHSLKQRTIQALCRLCHDTGVLVVGEGVETERERDMLVELGCDLLQGYLLGKPGRALPE